MAAALALAGGGVVGGAAAYAAPATVERGSGEVAGAARLKITSQPKARTVASGRKATFTVKVPRGAKVAWQVRKPGAKKYVTIKGATRTKLSVKATTKLNGARYRVTVAKGSARATSKAARLTVVTKPRFTTRPASKAAAIGTRVSFSAKASGGAVTYTWYRKAPGAKSWTKVTTGPTLSFTAKASHDGASFRAVAKNVAGRTTSSSAVLRTGLAPRITANPEVAIVKPGERAQFTAVASGVGLTYQWWRLPAGSTTWTKVPGATSATFGWSPKVAESGTSVKLVVSNRFGTATSEETGVLLVPTAAQPAGVGLTVSFGNVVGSWLFPAVDLGSDSDYPAPGAGYTYEGAVVLVGSFDERPFDGSRLEYGHVGADGASYEVVDVVDVSADLGAPGSAGGLAVYAVVARVPVGAHGGQWTVTDRTGATPVTTYFDLC